MVDGNGLGRRVAKRLNRRADSVGRRFSRPEHLYVIILCIGDLRKGVRVVDGNGLENRRARKGTVGSNPTPSAKVTSLLNYLKPCFPVLLKKQLKAVM